jgi:hypothetical protein
LREKVQNGEIAINWITTADMPTDGLTKPLSAQNHRKLLKHLSLVDISGHLRQAESQIACFLLFFFFAWLNARFSLPPS